MQTYITTICLLILLITPLSGCSPNEPIAASSEALENLVLIEGDELTFQGILSSTWHCGENHTIDLDMPVRVKGIEAKFSMNFSLLPETRVTFASGQTTNLLALSAVAEDFYLPDRIPMNSTLKVSFSMQEDGQWGVHSLQEMPAEESLSTLPEINTALPVNLLAKGETSALLSGSNFDGEEYRWLADIPVSFHGGKATLVLPMYLTKKTQISNEEGQHVKPDGQLPPGGWQEVRFTHKDNRLELVKLTSIPSEDPWTK